MPQVGSQAPLTMWAFVLQLEGSEGWELGWDRCVRVGGRAAARSSCVCPMSFSRSPLPSPI